MVTHYSTNGLDSACGRSSQTLVSTAVTEDVSCKTCQRSLAKPDTAAASGNKTPSLAELRKQAKPAVEAVTPAPGKPVAAPAKAASKPAAKAAGKPARSGGFSVKAAWAARLAEQSDRCRLPRGKVKQAHV
ncbi:hypothetical protein [Pseudomonas mosselii]|uniref:hypothetical protein n=1 Tax=Pseudomonas mosselii TaxID=78327 RepID=UPI0021621E44|nr:hypothetical protein [Pseudomonas mosselii]UVN43770.1 hypothetical protein NW905_22120 [Pseudomonas mosselii]